MQILWVRMLQLSELSACQFWGSRKMCGASTQVPRDCESRFRDKMSNPTMQALVRIKKIIQKWNSLSRRTRVLRARLTPKRQTWHAAGQERRSLHNVKRNSSDPSVVALCAPHFFSANFYTLDVMIWLTPAPCRASVVSRRAMLFFGSGLILGPIKVGLRAIWTEQIFACICAKKKKKIAVVLTAN